MYPRCESAISSKKWKGPSHHDYSVIWWKKYAYFANLQKPLNNQEFELCNALKILRLKEICGIKIGLSNFNECPIHNEEIPSRFLITTELPACINYNNALKEPIDAPAGLSQISNVEDLCVEDNIQFDLMLDNTSSTAHKTFQRTSPYNYLITSFRELCSYLEGNCTEKDLIRIKKFFLDETCLLKKQHLVGQSMHPKGRYVSSNVDSSKRKRTHGNRRF